MECAAKGLGSHCAPVGATASCRCGLCGAVSYCSRDHQEDGEQNPICAFLALKGLHGQGLWKFMCNCLPLVASTSNLRITNNWNLLSADCPCSDPESPISVPLKTWAEYYNWRCLPLHSPVALLLHLPLTLYNCLQTCSSRCLISNGKRILNIHYLGPEQELLQLAVLGELLALVPGTKFNIEIVGPAVPQFRDGETISISNYPCCLDGNCCCKCLGNSGNISSDRGTITVKLHKGLYHERHRDLDSFPDLIVAPNAGIAAYPTWLPTIELIKYIKAPAMFTDFCEEAAFLASNCIRSITSQPLSVPVQVNPFRQPSAFRTCGLNLPCYSNCFIFGI